MNNLMQKQIAIIGGGPGGLTLARLLQMKGARVTVYERDRHENARPKGATLDLHEESGLRAVREAGLTEAFEANYRPGADLLRIVDQHAGILFDDHERTVSDRTRPEIDRGPLQKLLLESLAPGTVTWDRQALSLTPTGTGWTIGFHQGEPVYADIVIVADGANSRLRAYLTPVRPFYSGIMIVEGLVPDAAARVPALHKLMKGGKVFALGDSKSLIASSKGDGSLAFYTGCALSETWIQDSGIDFNDKEQVLSWFRKAYTGWDPLWEGLFREAATPLIPRPQYCMPFDQDWEPLSNLTMLGDAAHLMPPYAGEGVNMAMLDAVELSACLTSEQFADTRSAIAHYEKEMRRRAAQTAADTMESTKALHSPDAVAWMLDILQ